MTPLTPPIRICFLVLAMVLAAALASFGGGGSAPAPARATGTGSGGGTGTSPPPAAGNVVAVTLDGGADGSAFNSAFVSVTVCQPGTQNCQAVDHVLVDTGSFGLRLAASALQSGLALPTT